MKHLNVGSAILIAAAALVVGAVFGQPGSGRAAGTGPVNTRYPNDLGHGTAGADADGEQRELGRKPDRVHLCLEPMRRKRRLVLRDRRRNRGHLHGRGH